MKKIMAIVGMFILGMIFLSGCTQNDQSSYDPPNIRVIDDISRFGYEGIDYVVWIDVIVRNYGGPGATTVYCKINQDNNEYLKSHRVYLNAGETTDLTFRFAEYSFWSSDGGSWRIWVE